MKNSRLVYSSELGRICTECSKPVAECICKKRTKEISSTGFVKVQRETKGRGGKTVTVITGLPGSEASVKLLAGELKKKCGTGGTFKDGTIEIQGNHVEMLVEELKKRGYNAKRAGG
ncbi:MAG: translation initiation factor Sui1 [Desulfuromonadales bacterium]|nr:translation initiation factor Sui1 [Desulfuromonadales bacterium]